MECPYCKNQIKVEKERNRYLVCIVCHKVIDLKEHEKSKGE